MTPSASTENAPAKRSVARLWLIAVMVAAAGFLPWLGRANSGLDVLELSHEDGKSRFYATAYPTMNLPSSTPLLQRLLWKWLDSQKRLHLRHTPAKYTLTPSPVCPCSIGMLKPVHGGFRAPAISDCRGKAAALR